MNLNEQFIDIPLDKRHIHLYVVRTSIVNSLKKHLPEMKGKLLDVGSGYGPYRELFLSPQSKVEKYISLDLEDQRSYQNKPDLTWDGKTIPLENNTIGTVIATEVLEHCPDPLLMLKEAHRVLEPGGKLFFSVPFFWMLHEVPHDEFRYTPFSLERLAKEAGFKTIQIRALSGWNASLVQMFANWVYYSDEKYQVRSWALRLFWPFLKFLLRRDKIPEGFQNKQMMTGLFGIAEK